MMNVNKIDRAIEDLINEIAAHHLPGDIINLSYSTGNVKITIK